MQPNDEELLRRIGEGDMYVFDTLVEKWEHNLINLIYRIIGDFHIAEDVDKKSL